MKPYRTLATVRLFSGVIGLTDKQAERRMSCLSKTKGRVYEINKEVTFKAGEVIGLEYAPKPYRRLLECLEPKIEPVKEPVTEEVKKPVRKPSRAKSKRKA